MSYIYLLFRILPLATFVSLYCYSGIQLAIFGYLLALLLEAVGLFALKSFHIQEGFRCGLGAVLSGVAYETSNITFFMLDLSIFYLGSTIVIFYGLLRKSKASRNQNPIFEMITQNKFAFSISALMCLSLAISNVIVYYHYPLEIWVYFRVIAPIVFSTVFPMILGLLSAFKYNPSIQKID